MTKNELEIKASEYSCGKYSLPVNEIICDDELRKKIYEGEDSLNRIKEEIDFYAAKHDLQTVDEWIRRAHSFHLVKAIRNVSVFKEVAKNSIFNIIL